MEDMPISRNGKDEAPVTKTVVLYEDNVAIAQRPGIVSDVSKSGKQNNRRRRLVIGIVILVLVLFIIGLVGYRVYQKQSLQVGMLTYSKELEKIAATGKVDKKIYAKGYAASLERMTKEQLASVSNRKANYITSLIQLQRDLNTGTYVSDGPDFALHFRDVDSTKSLARDYYDRVSSFVNVVNTTATSNSDVVLMQKAFGKVIGIPNGQSTKMFLSAGQAAQKNVEISCDKLFTFLEKTRSAWTVEKGSIVFNQRILTNQYTTLKAAADSSLSHAIVCAGQ